MMSLKRDICIIGKLSGYGETDVSLLCKVREGDPCAFEQLYHRWNRRVYGFMLKTVCSVSDAEDITQEVFVRLWKMRENIDPQKNFPSLIFVIARRIAVDMYRRNGKMAVTPCCDVAEWSMSEKSPLEILEEQEMNLLLEIAIQSMSEKQRNVFTLYYFQNLSPKEIALQLGLSYDNVRKHIYNGKRQLREIASLMIVFLLGQT